LQIYVASVREQTEKELNEKTKKKTASNKRLANSFCFSFYFDLLHCIIFPNFGLAFLLLLAASRALAPAVTNSLTRSHNANNNTTSNHTNRKKEVAKLQKELYI
jgi:hypothetical protein